MGRLPDNAGIDDHRQVDNRTRKCYLCGVNTRLPIAEHDRCDDLIEDRIRERLTRLASR